MTSCIVVAKAFGNELAGGALDHFKGVVSDWLDDEARWKLRSDGVWLLIEFSSGQTCTLAQPLQEWRDAET